MAGGKETPRQKLIGLMYLVLLALLALQVSGEIMVKFFFLEKSLEKAKTETIERNKVHLATIEKNINDLGTKDPEILKPLDIAKQVRKETEDMLVYIQGLKDELQKVTGGLDENGFYVGAKEEDAVGILMVGNETTGKGKGYALQTKLEAYYKNIIKFAKEVDIPNPEKEITPLALDAKDDPLLKNNEDQKNKDFVELNFAHTPLVAAMAVLAEKMNKIASYETLILGHIDPNKSRVVVDEIFADFKAESRVVAAGTKYIAQIFMAGRSKGIKPKVFFEGRAVEVDAGGFGKVEFTATGGTYDKDGNLKKTWKGEVVYAEPGKPEKRLPVQGEYIVAKPVIDIKSTSVSALYIGCANPLQINVPALGASYNPSFSVTNANKKTGAAKGELIVIPTVKAKVKIGVSSDGNFIGDREFDVKDIPNPVVSVETAKGPINPILGEKATLGGIKINIISDKGFAEALPKEANYEISKAVLRQIRGKDVVGGAKPVSGSTVIFSKLGVQLRAGDQISLEIQEIVRTNSEGQRFPVKLLPSASFQSFRIVD